MHSFDTETTRKQHFEYRGVYYSKYLNLMILDFNNLNGIEFAEFLGALW